MKNKIIYFRESLLQSVLADTYTFACLVGVGAANYYLLGGSRLMFGALIVFWFMWVIGKANSKNVIFTDKEELIKHLQSSA